MVHPKALLCDRRGDDHRSSPNSTGQDGSGTSIMNGGSHRAARFAISRRSQGNEKSGESSVMHRRNRTAVWVLGLAAGACLGADAPPPGSTLTGKAALGDWTTDAP